MKNIQIIDDATNCTFSLFQATDEEFQLLFPEPRQDIQYAEDLGGLPQDEIAVALQRIWERPIRKQDIQGIARSEKMRLSGVLSMQRNVACSVSPS
jgi:hypothetical protein